MKKLSFILLMTVGFLAVNAQCKIYSGRYASGDAVAVFDNGKIYS